MYFISTDLEELVQERSLHGLGARLATKALLENGLARALETARHPRPRQQHVRLQHQQACMHMVVPALAEVTSPAMTSALKDTMQIPQQ